MTIDVLMIHSPLVGPGSLEPLAAELRRRGLTVVLPDLRSALSGSRPLWRRILDAATAAAVAVAADSPDVIVAHSGAGALLPSLAERLDPDVVAFVDAVVPGDGSHHSASEAFLGLIDALPLDGPLLPPWHEWWGPDVMTRLVPDADLRRRLAADTPRVPRSFYDDPVHLPDGWSARRGCCFLQLSSAYDDDRARADAYGWPTAGAVGQHLDVAVRPVSVCDALVGLIDRARPR